MATLAQASPALGALLACAVAAVYATWPLAQSLGSGASSDVGDPMELAWIIAWFSHAVLAQPLNIFDGNIFWPKKGTLAFTESFIGISIFVAPIFWLTGNALLTMNSATLAVYIVGGFGMAFLVAEITGSWSAGAVAGVAFTVAPYRVISIGHLHVVAIHLVPYVLGLLVRVRRRGTGRWSVPAIAGLVALQFWSSLTGAALLMVVVGVWGVWALATEGRKAMRPLVPAVVAVTIGVALAAPLLVVVTSTQRANPEYSHPPEEALLLSAHARSFLSPAPGGPVVRGLYATLQERFVDADGAVEKILFPGVVLSGVAVVTTGAIAVAVARRVGRGRWPRWASGVGLLTGIGVVGYTLSLGPRVGGRPDGLALPYRLLSVVPGGLLRVPARFGQLVTFALAGLVGVLVGHLPARMRIGAAGLVLVALAVEAAPPNIPVVRPRLTAAAATSDALSSGQGAVLALPMTEMGADGTIDYSSIVVEPVQMYLSTRHFRPLVNGYAAFAPAGYYEIVGAVQDLPSVGAFTMLRQRQVRTVVVMNSLVSGTPWEGVVSRLAAWPGVRLVSESPETTVFDVSAASEIAG